MHELAKVQQAARQLLDREDVLILDTETTGLGQAEVIEVSLIDTRGEVLLDTLVQPRVPDINPFAQRVHRITPSMLEHQPTWPEVLPELHRLTSRATVLAWNASFDARMLENSSRTWRLEHPRILFVCAMKLYAKKHGRGKFALHRAVSHEGLEHLFEQHQSHRALGDTRFVLEVLRKVADPS